MTFALALEQIQRESFWDKLIAAQRCPRKGRDEYAKTRLQPALDMLEAAEGEYLALQKMAEALNTSSASLGKLLTVPLAEGKIQRRTVANSRVFYRFVVEE